MSIRVAYDVSFLGRFFGRPDEQSGVYRVVEELLCALSRRDDVMMTAVGLCGDDPLADSVRSLLYVQGRARDLSCDFRHSFRSRLGLGRLYEDAFVAAASGELDRLPRYSPRAVWVRRLRGLLYRLAYTYKVDELRHALDAGDFDVFHSPFLKLPPRSLVGDMPRVLTVYDLIFLKHPEFMAQDMLDFLHAVFDSVDVERDWVTCISEFTKREFCEHTGMSPERVFVTPLATAEHFRPVRDAESIADARRRYGIPEGPYLLSLAALQPRKNLDHLIRCFFRLLAEHPSLGANLVLVGKDSWKTEKIFAAATASPQFRHRVVFTDYVPDEDLSAIYSGASAFVFPSLYEGFGLPSLEAMKCGTPVVTSNNTAFPEVVGGAGVMVDPKDADALCQAMLTLVTDDALRRKLSAAGLERARAFSWEACAEKTAELYRSAVAAE